MVFPALGSLQRNLWEQLHFFLSFILSYLLLLFKSFTVPYSANSSPHTVSRCWHPYLDLCVIAEFPEGFWLSKFPRMYIMKNIKSDTECSTRHVFTWTLSRQNRFTNVYGSFILHSYPAHSWTPLPYVIIARLTLVCADLIWCFLLFRAHLCFRQTVFSLEVHYGCGKVRRHVWTARPCGVCWFAKWI